jgi:hypothetical protein
MAKQLTLDEMLEVLILIKDPIAAHLRAHIEKLGSAMAQLIALRLDVCAGRATFQGTAFAGTCAPFTPRYPGQSCPEPLCSFDASQWDEEGSRAQDNKTIH